jgi:small membrane protein
VIIQFLLIIALVAVAGYALTQRKRSPLIFWIVMMAALCGAILVIAPELSTRIAHLLGVGRGADLVFYVFILVIFVATFNIHLRIRSNHELITELARSIALQSARAPKERA